MVKGKPFLQPMDALVVDLEGRWWDYLLPQNLAVGNVQTGEAPKGLGSLFEGRVHGASPAHELGHGRGVLMVQAQLLVQRTTPPLRAEVVGAAQLDGTGQGYDLTTPPGMKLLARPQLHRGQQLWQLVVEELLHNGGGVLLGRRPQHRFEPDGVHGPLAGNLLPGPV